ncbi:MAG: uracil-DNA glycosylase [Mahellales bacterium]
MDRLIEAVKYCTKCKLHKTRSLAVPGEGQARLPIMFVGEGPGYHEDIQGRPFVGKAGQLLTKMIEAIDFDRQDIYITNIVKCRPPGNKVPEEAEAMACLPYLRYQVFKLKPKIIVCLGATAAKYIISRDIRITRDRGKWFQRKGYYLMPTYHPAALLRDPAKKRDAWEDLKKIKQKYNEITQTEQGD